MASISPLDIRRVVTNRLKLVTDTEPETITLEELMAQVRVDAHDEDDLLGALIVAARKHTEKRIGRKIRKQTWRMQLAHFPWKDELYLPYPPFVAIEHVKFTDRDGDLNTSHDINSSPVVTSTTFSFEVDTEPGFIFLNPSAAWPTDSLFTGLPVEIQFQCGLEAPLDKDLYQAMLMLAGHWFQHREAVVIGSLGQMNALSTGTVPMGYEALVEKFVFMSE